MVIDFHTHIFPEKIAKKTIELLAQNTNGTAFTDGTVEGLLTQMERANVDISVCLPVLTKPSQFDSVLRFALEVNQRFIGKEKRLISFAGIHPACDDIDGKMKLIRDSGLLGVKIHPDYQETFIDDEGYIKILKSANDNGLIVVTHAGVDDGYKGKPVRCPPVLSKKVIEKVKPEKFVLGHFGGHSEWQEVLDLLCDKDVYFDTAFTLHEIDKDLFKKIVNAHGDDKIVFATDCPWRDMKQDIDTLKSFNLGKDKEENIFYKNAIKLLGL